MIMKEDKNFKQEISHIYLFRHLDSILESIFVCSDRSPLAVM